MYFNLIWTFMYIILCFYFNRFTLQSLNKLVKIARENKYIAHGLSHTWVTYYESSVTSDIPRINEW